MKPSNRHSLLTLLAILGMGLALSASRLKLPAFTQSATPAQAQAAPAVAAPDVPDDPASAERSVTLQTDKVDYAPGEVIIVRGSGFDPGEAVTLLLHEERASYAEPAAHADRSVTVIADSSGNIWDNRLTQNAHNRGVMLQLTATGRSSGLSTQAMFANPSATLDQCANDADPSPHTNGCASLASQWVNGNLGASKSVYFEGDSIPYRLVFANLATTGTAANHTVTIEWDTTKSSKHALDYLTTFNQTVTDANPCLGVDPCGSPVSFAIPADPQVAGAGVTPVDGNITLYGGTGISITRPSKVGNISCTDANSSGVYCYSSGTGFTGDKSAAIAINFTASVANPVLAWGGHISTRTDWPDGSAVAISGSPYHTRLIGLDGAGGNQDRSLSAAAVIFPGRITIQKTVSDATTGATFDFTASPTPLPSSFQLAGDNSGTANVNATSNITDFQTYTVTEGTPPAGWTLTSISCVINDPGVGQNGTGWDASGKPALTISLVEGEFITCTFSNNFVPTPTPTFTPTNTPVPPTATPTNTPTATPTPFATPNMTTAQNLIPNDSATLSGGLSASGTIIFNLYSPSDGTCSGSPALTQTLNVSGDNTYSTTNTTFKATDVGTWRWKVLYSGDSQNVPKTLDCGVEQFTITNEGGSIGSSSRSSLLRAITRR